MIFVPGGSFRMGSDRYCPEEGSVPRVERTPATNRQKEFVEATGGLTLAESPGALLHMINARGGWHLCAPNCCRRNRAAACHAEPIERACLPCSAAQRKLQ